MNELTESPEVIKSTYKLFRVDRQKEIIVANDDLNAEVGDTYRVTDGNIPIEMGEEKEKSGSYFKAISDAVSEPGFRKLRGLKEIEI